VTDSCGIHSSINSPRKREKTNPQTRTRRGRGGTQPPDKDEEGKRGKPNPRQGRRGEEGEKEGEKEASPDMIPAHHLLSAWWSSICCESIKYCVAWTAIPTTVLLRWTNDRVHISTKVYCSAPQKRGFDSAALAPLLPSVKLTPRLGASKLTRAHTYRRTYQETVV